MKTKKKHQKSTLRRITSHKTLTAQTRLPFIEHALELRRRLYYVGISVVVVAAAAYGIQQHIVNILLRPARGEHFIYTTPGGGIDFLFRICLYTGLVVSMPVIVYNSLRFIEPLISRASWRFVVWGSAASGLLALVGILFGYFLGLPAALHFLMHQFTTIQIKPLVTIQSYLGFVIVYMVGSSMIFQLPLILLFINRIKPLKPKKLLHYERWVILVAFILSGLMNPTPNMISQLLVAGPFIIVYQVGILLIMYINRTRKVDQFYQHDLEVQTSRLAQQHRLQSLPARPSAIAHTTPTELQQAYSMPISKQASPHRVVMQASQSRPVRPLSRDQIYSNRKLHRQQGFSSLSSRFSQNSVLSIDGMLKPPYN